jgi:hypothetical protein
MLVKRGKVEIMDVIKDDDHNLDDEGTRKAMDKAAKSLENKKTVEETKAKTVEN